MSCSKFKARFLKGIANLKLKCLIYCIYLFKIALEHKNTLDKLLTNMIASDIIMNEVYSVAI